MSAVLAVNIGYSPQHAARPRGPAVWHQRGGGRALVILVVIVVALLCAGRNHRGASRGTSHGSALLAGRTGAVCRARPATDRAGTLPQVAAIYSGPKLGLRGPAGADVREPGTCGSPNRTGNSVTQFGWRSARHPVVLTRAALRVRRTWTRSRQGHGHLWIANSLANSITELSATDGSANQDDNDRRHPEFSCPLR